MLRIDFLWCFYHEMAICVNEYKKGNIKLFKVNGGYNVMYKDNPLYLKLDGLHCTFFGSKNSVLGSIKATTLSKSTIDVLDDIQISIETDLLMRGEHTRDVMDSGNIFMYTKPSFFKYGISLGTSFEADLTISIELKYRPFERNPKYLVLAIWPEDLMCRPIYKSLTTKDCIDLQDIKMSNISICNDRQKTIMYNDSSFVLYIPSNSYTLFTSSKTDANLVLDDNLEIITVLRTIKKVIKILTKSNISMDTFVIDRSTKKTGDYTKYVNRGSFIASLTCKFIISDNGDNCSKLTMLIDSLCIDETNFL